MDYEISEILREAHDERKRILVLLRMTLLSLQIGDEYKRSAVLNARSVLMNERVFLSMADSEFLKEVKLVMYLTGISLDDMSAVLWDLKDLI